MKTRVVVKEAPVDTAALPKSVRKFAAAKAKKSVTPSKPKKPAVDVAQLEKSLKEAVTAKAESESRVKVLESELREERAAKRLLQRTVEHLQSVIDELKAKEVKPNWLRRLFGRA